jgi:hypothetical protein
MSKRDAARIQRAFEVADKRMDKFTDENLVGIAKAMVRFINSPDAKNEESAIVTRRDAVAAIVAICRPHLFLPAKRRHSVVIGGQQ